MSLNSPVFVRGGAGIKGSCFVLQWLAKQNLPMTLLHKLAYAGNLGNLASVMTTGTASCMETSLTADWSVGFSMGSGPVRSCISPMRATWTPDPWPR